MTEGISSILRNWIPFRLFEEGGNNCCRWLYLGDEKISEPFFEETIAKCRSLPDNSKLMRSVSSIEILPEWASQIETIFPTAIIFHISRCGSTLISQLLGLQPANVVLSEVPFFDELLRWGNKNNMMKTALPLLNAAINFYGAKRIEKTTHLFIKADSWHVHFYRQLRELYPQTPFILLYRRPDEVIRSQQKRRGMQSIHGVIEPEIFGFNQHDIAQLDLNEYMSRVLETYLEAFIQILNTDKMVLPVNYSEGAMKLVKKIAAFSGITISEEEASTMQRRTKFHAKYPEQVFTETQVQEPLPAWLNKSIALYNEVEKIRLAVTRKDK